MIDVCIVIPAFIERLSDEVQYTHYIRNGYHMNLSFTINTNAQSIADLYGLMPAIAK